MNSKSGSFPGLKSALEKGKASDVGKVQAIHADFILHDTVKVKLIRNEMNQYISPKNPNSLVVSGKMCENGVEIP